MLILSSKHAKIATLCVVFLAILAIKKPSPF